MKRRNFLKSVLVGAGLISTNPINSLQTIEPVVDNIPDAPSTSSDSLGLQVEYSADGIFWDKNPPDNYSHVRFYTDPIAKTTPIQVRDKANDDSYMQWKALHGDIEN